MAISPQYSQQNLGAVELDWQPQAIDSTPRRIASVALAVTAFFAPVNVPPANQVVPTYAKATFPDRLDRAPALGAYLQQAYAVRNLSPIVGPQGIPTQFKALYPDLHNRVRFTPERQLAAPIQNNPPIINV